jgi:hypothetical protein
MFKSSNDKLLALVLFFTLLFTFTWTFSFYSSSNNVDFYKYYGYINYFTGIGTSIDYGQGVFYYFLIAKRLLSKVEMINFENYENILNLAIQEVNFIFFLIGLLGFFYLLKLKNYKTDVILASLITLVFFPQVLYLRAVMKPEILAFAFIPWVLINLETYRINKRMKHLFYAIPFLILILNSKGSITGMTLLFLLFSYGGLIKQLSYRNFALLFISSTILFAIVQYETYSFTGNTLFERPYDKEYDYKASPQDLFNINFYEAIMDSNFSVKDGNSTPHSDSVINTIMLDTFGDYFNQFFNSDIQEYSANYRKIIFTNSEENSFFKMRQINYDGIFSEILINNLDNIRRIVSLIFSIFFYCTLIILIILDKTNRIYYLAPFIGIFILFLNSLGVPSNNYNPIKGDTYKAFYFSFLICISFLFLVAKIFQSINFSKIIILTLFVTSMLFVIGHPKENSQKLSEHLINVNQFSPICSINNMLVYENKILKSFVKSGNINNLTSGCQKKTLKIKNEQAKKDFDNLNEKNCVDVNGEVLKEINENNILKENSPICRIYVLEQIKANNNLTTSRIPYFSILVFLISLQCIFLEAKKYFEKY